MYQRRRGTHSGISNGQEAGSKQAEEIGRTGSSWRRILLLILAITIHNIPGLSGLWGFTHKTHTIITVVKRFAPEVYHTLLADKKCLGDKNLDKTQRSHMIYWHILFAKTCSLYIPLVLQDCAAAVTDLVFTLRDYKCVWGAAMCISLCIKLIWQTAICGA